MGQAAVTPAVDLIVLWQLLRTARFLDHPSVLGLVVVAIGLLALLRRARR